MTREELIRQALQAGYITKNEAMRAVEGIAIEHEMIQAWGSSKVESFISLDPTLIPTSSQTVNPYIEMAEEQAAYLRDKLEAEMHALFEGPSNSFKPIILPSPALVQRAGSCSLCNGVISPAQSGCRNPACLGLSDGEWAQREAREWFLGHEPEEFEFLPVEEFEERLWVAMTDPPAHRRWPHIDPGPSDIPLDTAGRYLVDRGWTAEFDVRPMDPTNSEER